MPNDIYRSRDAEIEEINRLREIEEIKRLRKQTTGDDLARSIADFGFGAAGAIGKGLSNVSDFVGRGIRAGIESATTDRSYVDAYEKPPGWKELYERGGLSGENFAHLPLIKDPWGKTKDEKYFGVSPAGLAAGLTEAAVDPFTYLGTKPIEQAVGAVAKGAKNVGEQLVFKGGRIVTGVREPAAREYLKRYLEIKKGVPTLEELRGSIDVAASDVAQDVAATRSRYESAEKSLGDKYKQLRTDLEGKTTTLSEARSIMADLNQEKSVLGALSDQADDALVRSGVMFQRDHLLQLIDKVGSSIGPDIVGDQAKAAVSRLMDTRERLAGLPEVIPPDRLRNILQQIRKDIDFDLKAGEFNTELNSARKALAGGISKALKDASPEYAAYMDRMASLSKNLGDMSKHFGTEQAGITSMEAVRRGRSPASQVIEDRLREYAKATGRTDLITKLDEFSANRGTLERMKQNDLRAQIFPDDFKRLQELEAEKAMAENIQKGVKRITPERSQSIIQSQMSRQQPSLLDREHLERLGHTAEQDFVRQIENRGLLDSFNKDGTRGSRLTVAGSAAGSALGAALSPDPATIAAFAAAGGGIGAGLDRYGGGLYKGLLNNLGFAREAVEPALKALQENRLGRFAPIVAKAARGGARTLIVTHHLLMQNYPEYAARIGEP